MRHAIGALLLRIERAQPMAQLGAGHGALELGTLQHGGQEAVLVQQHVFVEGHVGDADGALVAQRAVVAPDGDLEDGPVAMRVERAVAVVIAHGVGGREIRHPAGFKQRNQPGLMLAGNRHRPRHRHRKRTSLTDGVIEDGVNTPQEGAAERGKTVRDQVAERVALIDTLYFDRRSVIVWARAAFTSILLELAAETFESLFQFGDFALEGGDALLQRG